MSDFEKDPPTPFHIQAFVDFVTQNEGFHMRGDELISVHMYQDAEDQEPDYNIILKAPLADASEPTQTTITYTCYGGRLTKNVFNRTDRAQAALDLRLAEYKWEVIRIMLEKGKTHGEATADVNSTRTISKIQIGRFLDAALNGVVDTENLNNNENEPSPLEIIDLLQRLKAEES